MAHHMHWTDRAAKAMKELHAGTGGGNVPTPSNAAGNSDPPARGGKQVRGVSVAPAADPTAKNKPRQTAGKVGPLAGKAIGRK